MLVTWAAPAASSSCWTRRSSADVNHCRAFDALCLECIDQHPRRRIWPFAAIAAQLRRCLPCVEKLPKSLMVGESRICAPRSFEQER